MKKLRSSIFHIKSNRGYTLLFSVLTAALVLSVAVFILGVSKKQLALATAARESMYSLYAADSATECAVAITTINTSAPITIKCNGGDSAATNFSPYSDSVSWPGGLPVFRASDILVLLDGTTNDRRCARVTITDGDYVSGGNTMHKTIIESRGYNYCDANGQKASSRTVERAIRVTYQ